MRLARLILAAALRSLADRADPDPVPLPWPDAGPDSTEQLERMDTFVRDLAESQDVTPGTARAQLAAALGRPLELHTVMGWPPPAADPPRPWARIARAVPSADGGPPRFLFPGTTPGTVEALSPASALVDAPCPTCTGASRETTGMVCQTCGTDYATDPPTLIRPWPRETPRRPPGPPTPPPPPPGREVG